MGESAPARSDVLTRAKAGDLAAFDELMILYQRQVLGTAYRLLGQVPDAQDAAQEVFLKLYRHIRKFDETRSLSPWLYTVTVNVCRDLIRKRPHLAEMPEVAEEPRSERTVIDTQLVAMGLRRLTEKERQALVLRDLEGLSTSEVARILGSSEATVRSQISTARARFREFYMQFRGRKK